MMRNISYIDNENGSLMVIALLIMVTLAVAGLMVTKDAVMEGHVGRNYAIHKQCESSAEAAGKEMIQAIESVFIDPANVTAAEAVADLAAEGWRPYDDYNATFDFNADFLRDGTYVRILTSDLQGDPAYITTANTIAVLVDQTTSVLSPGLGGGKVPEYYTYTVYCRAVHAGAGNSESILMIGYRQEKI